MRRSPNSSPLASKPPKQTNSHVCSIRQYEFHQKRELVLILASGFRIDHLVGDNWLGKRRTKPIGWPGLSGTKRIRSGQSNKADIVTFSESNNQCRRNATRRSLDVPLLPTGSGFPIQESFRGVLYGVIRSNGHRRCPKCNRVR